MAIETTLMALLYAAGEQGIELAKVAAVLQVDTAAIREQLQYLQDRLSDPRSPWTLQQYGDSYKLLTKASLHKVIEEYLQLQQAATLSPAATEVLAIIAYRQPITRIEIDAIRGVKNSSGTIQALLARQLIKANGHKKAPGRPLVYVTTEFFLDYFGLQSLMNLPDWQEFASVTDPTTEFEEE
ncbi:SMC-Scp complex subunit ScpB [Lactobacillus sp. DCY120]|uniref:SMC-Scp complex subunit ScpB n=1 Tax=Bombilactobacillus apium TaxID=2675299 RepID=A0A850R577_9LACO|nr:SMC-Scp complex subunit ScpB [Bombilactobacillus apium]NVY95752.1 SMC-Scp complex subunit ScpB [Bombilactobacillus apium]